MKGIELSLKNNKLNKPVKMIRYFINSVFLIATYMNSCRATCPSSIIENPVIASGLQIYHQDANNYGTASEWNNNKWHFGDNDFWFDTNTDCPASNCQIVNVQADSTSPALPTITMSNGQLSIPTKLLYPNETLQYFVYNSF